MLLSEEQKENFIDQLQHTTVKGGEYLIMPNASNPAFIVPAYSKEVFIKALALIKPLSGKGELKKRMLSYIPPKWLKRKLPTISIENSNSGDLHTIILPWSQDINAKVTFISFSLDMNQIQVHKYAFNEQTRSMVRNEHDFLKRIDTSKHSGISVPQVKGFNDSEKFTSLSQEFFDGMHMKNVSPRVSSFFSELNQDEIHELESHPYIKNRMPLIQEELNSIGETELLNELNRLFNKFKKERFQVATMHSDFSSTNTVKTSSNEYVIIDWEDACDDGVCIDAEYFKFRRNLQVENSWMIQSAENFLAVFHYTYFMVKKKNKDMLEKFQLNNGVFSLS